MVIQSLIASLVQPSVVLVTVSSPLRPLSSSSHSTSVFSPGIKSTAQSLSFGSSGFVNPLVRKRIVGLFARDRKESMAAQASVQQVDQESTVSEADGGDKPLRIKLRSLRLSELDPSEIRGLQARQSFLSRHVREYVAHG